ncbi:hypothetical protein [Bradyrhizobium septentrionale]|uniref:Uncharacterized protein n=1 Tax=Bradyrhizobium septentrionale TaxID=1404411 RepID=A0ABZ2P2Q9_9BRAD
MIAKEPMADRRVGIIVVVVTSERFMIASRWFAPTVLPGRTATREIMDRSANPVR